MKKMFIIMFLLSGVIVSCIDTGSLDYLSSITDSDRDSDRRGNIGRRKFSRSSNQCEDSERCENICDQMLDYSKERRNCYGLSLKEIGKIEDVFDSLKHPEDRLGKIRGGDFDLFASIALSSWSNLIRGEYRRDERNDDDDRDRDDSDPDLLKYTMDESKAVLNWLIDHPSFAESVRDFSGRDNHILFDLLIQSNDTLTCSGSGDEDEICEELKSSSLTSYQKTVLKRIKEEISTLPPNPKTYLERVVGRNSSKDEVSAIYELTHDLLSRVCEDVDSLEIDSRNYGRDHSYKICLSWAYFCDPSVYDDNSNQIDQYLFKDTYRKNPESSLTGCTFLTGDEPRWSDYWD